MMVPSEKDSPCEEWKAFVGSLEVFVDNIFAIRDHLISHLVFYFDSNSSYYCYYIIIATNFLANIVAVKLLKTT